MASGHIKSSHTRRLSGVFWLAVLTLAGLFFVNVMGFLDTYTGSALGCGRQWPLCNGRVIPHVWGLTTLIEFSHRGVVGVVTVLLLVLAFFAWRRYGRYIEVKAAILTAVSFVFLEALLGALGVLFPDPPALLASHFGIALLAFAGGLWLVVLIGQIDLCQSEFTDGQLPKGLLPAIRLSTSKTLRWLSWTTFAYTLGALYLGAYVASSGAGDVFQGWPFPTESGAEAHGMLWLDWAHRSVAFGLTVLLLVIWGLAWRQRHLRRDLLGAATMAVLLVAAQAATGAWLVSSHLGLQAFLAHVSTVTLLFGTISVIGLQTLPETNRVAFGAEGTQRLHLVDGAGNRKHA